MPRTAYHIIEFAQMHCCGNGFGRISLVALKNPSNCFILCDITITIFMKLSLYLLLPQNHHYNKMDRL